MPPLGKVGQGRFHWIAGVAKDREREESGRRYRKLAWGGPFALNDSVSCRVGFFVESDAGVGLTLNRLVLNSCWSLFLRMRSI